jgi:phosphatidylglycerophosphate synthase
MWIALAPALVVGVVAVIMCAYFITGPWRDMEREHLRRGGSMLLPAAVIAFFYWCVEPLVAWLARLGVRPKHITFGSLYLAGLAGLAIALGHFPAGVWLFALAAAADGLDGFLARKLGTGSRAGAFLDSFIDRVSEGAVFAGLAWYGAGGPLTWVAFVAVIASLLISYARARGEGLGVRAEVGLMQRPERLVLLVISLFLAPIAAVFLEPAATAPVYHVAIVGVGLLALLSSITAFRRARWIYRALQDEAASADTVPRADAPKPDAAG